MRFTHGLILGIAALLTSTLSAAQLTQSGTFTQDDDFVLIPITLSSTTLLTVQTTSFAGLVGFEPVLTLFDALGNILLQDATGGTQPAGCGTRGTDPISGYCLDKFIRGILNAGNYTLALTEYDNVPGGTLGDGFPETGNGNFTGPHFTGNPGSFVLFDGTQRNANWALTIDGADVPEPSTMGLVAGALAAAAVFSRRRK